MFIFASLSSCTIRVNWPVSSGALAFLWRAGTRSIGLWAKRILKVGRLRSVKVLALFDHMRERSVSFWDRSLLSIQWEGILSMSLWAWIYLKSGSLVGDLMNLEALASIRQVGVWSVGLCVVTIRALILIVVTMALWSQLLCAAETLAIWHYILKKNYCSTN